LVSGELADRNETSAEFAGGEGESVAFGNERRSEDPAEERLLFGGHSPLRLVATGAAGRSNGGNAGGMGGEVGGPQLVEAGASDLERGHGLPPGKGAGDEPFKGVAEMGETQLIRDLEFNARKMRSRF
jgi:hypothetical protein